MLKPISTSRPQIESSVESAGDETVLKLCLVTDALPVIAATYPYRPGRKAGPRIHYESFLPLTVEEETEKLAQLDAAAVAWDCGG